MPDFAAEGLLDGLEGEERAAREAMLRRLHERGATIDELRDAVREERLTIMLAERILGAPPRYTPAEVAERAGTDLEYLQRQRRAAGLPVADSDEVALSDLDLEAAEVNTLFRRVGLQDDVLLEAARVFGESASRAAAAAIATVREGLPREGVSDLDLALRLVDAADQLPGPTGRLLSVLYTIHLQEQTRNDYFEGAGLGGASVANAREVTVGFADLVGFTRLGQRIAPEDLGRVAGRLAEMATETADPPVRLVKTIGDAVMLVSPEPEPLLATALHLVDRAEKEGEDFPDLRAGVASGPATAQWGDWFGPPVNLASRVVGVARPSTVLATREVRDAAQDAFAWSSIRPRRLKGVDGPTKLYRARPRDA